MTGSISTPAGRGWRDALGRSPQSGGEDHLLQRRACQPKVERAPAQAPDRAGGYLQQVHPSLRVDASLGVYGPVCQAQRLHPRFDHPLQLGQHRPRLAGRGDQQGLLERGTGWCVGLVEHGQDGQVAFHHQALEGSFGSVQIRLGQERAVLSLPAGDGAHPFDGPLQGGRVVHPDHTLGGSGGAGLEDQGKAHPHRILGLITHRDEAGLGDLGCGQQLAHLQLVAGGAGGLRWVMIEAEALGGQGGDDYPCLVGRHHRIDRGAVGQVDDRLSRHFRVMAIDAHETIAHVEGRVLLGRNRELDPQGSGRCDEVGGAV